MRLWGKSFWLKQLKNGLLLKCKGPPALSQVKEQASKATFFQSLLATPTAGAGNE